MYVNHMEIVFLHEFPKLFEGHKGTWEGHSKIIETQVKRVLQLVPCGAAITGYLSLPDCSNQDGV